MEFTYDTIEKWMKDYFQTYSTRGQSPESADCMNEFFAPDLRFIPYMAKMGGPEGGFHSSAEFISKAKSHPSWYEKLAPQEMTIDERNKGVAVRFGMEVMNRKTGEVAVKKTAIAQYQLALDENDTIKIKTIRFFWEVLPPDVPEFYDLFQGE